MDRNAGSVWTAAAHIVTAVIGSGVLSLAWSISKLGWILGPSTLLVFAIITYFSSSLLADCYRTELRHGGSSRSSTDLCSSNRNYTYMEAVRSHLGKPEKTRNGSSRTLLRLNRRIKESPCAVSVAAWRSV
jgi:amino acid permease